jgi:periplasmic protein TonB
LSVVALNPSAYTENHKLSSDSDRLFWLALSFSLLLHVGLYYVLPYLQSSSVQPIKRIVVELNMSEQQQAVSEPAPESKVEPTPIEPKPQQVIKEQVKPQKPVEVAPVLATESPSAASNYVAPPAPAPVSESTPEPTKSSNTSAATPTSNVSAEQTDSSEVSRDEAWDGYGQALYEMVGRNKNYPQIAIRRNWEGQAKVLAKFILGKLVDVTLIDSSGHEVLDKEALSMLRKAVSQLPVHGNLAKKTFTVTVPVDFKLAEQ